MDLEKHKELGCLGRVFEIPKNKFKYFNKYYTQNLQKFVCYSDFETLSQKVEEEDKLNVGKSKTTYISKHDCFAAAYKWEIPFINEGLKKN